MLPADAAQTPAIDGDHIQQLLTKKPPLTSWIMTNFNQYKPKLLSDHIPNYFPSNCAVLTWNTQSERTNELITKQHRASDCNHAAQPIFCRQLL